MSSLHPGDVLENRYELLKTWSAGGMGSVWLARVRGTHGFEKLFAVKVPLRDDDELRAMFVDEARIMSQIRHGNVIAVEHLGEHDGAPYLALEWVQGTSWMDFIDACHRAGTLPDDVMLRIASGALAGLHASHELRDETGHFLDVVHRDVSPHNVLVSETGLAKVIDFGIAKARGRMSERTRAGMVKAKLEFAAPEQLGFRRVDRRTDIWGMGVVLHLVFVGRLPFEADDDRGIIGAIARGLPGPLPGRVPPAIADVIRTALQVDPRERFQTAAEMKAAVDACIRSKVSPETVAECLAAYMAPALEMRRQQIRLAIEEANLRTNREPTTTAAPAATRSVPAANATDATRPPPRMTTTAWLVVATSTLLALLVWSQIASLAVSTRHRATTSPEGRPAP
jgi:serine/threonine-protein kinase